MKTQLGCYFTLVLLLSVNQSYCQQNDEKIKLEKAEIEQTASYAVWRTDFYICTGLAYAKRVGTTTDNFMDFVIETHGPTLDGMKGQGLEPVIKLINFVVTNYPTGTFEIITETDKHVQAKFNRPYSGYFKNGPMLGVTLDEFEKFLWTHISVALKRIDVDFKYEVKEDHITASFLLEK